MILVGDSDAASLVKLENHQILMDFGSENCHFVKKSSPVSSFAVVSFWDVLEALFGHL